MQPFLERVVGHLERVQRVSEREVHEAEVLVDLARFEDFVVRLFDEANGAGTWRWDPGYLHRFVEESYWDLLDGRGAQWTALGRFHFIELVIREASRLAHRYPPIGEGTRRLVKAMEEAVTSRIALDATQSEAAVWRVVPRYCDQLGLTHRGSHTTKVAAAGAPLLRLRGIDRLRWLLAVETTVASSSLDRWCMDLASARSLSRQRQWWLDPRDDDPPPANDDAIHRWTALGALRDATTEDTAGAQAIIFEVTEVGAQLFAELAADDATTFRTLARAMLEDEREQVLAPFAGADRAQDRATEATLRHARMVAHELRNTLLPIQFALMQIWEDPAMSNAALAEPRREIEAGVARLHRFVDESLRLTPITPDEAIPFFVMEAIEEARQRCDPAPGGGVLLEAQPGNANPRCRGHRGRFVLALLNLLRNAVQVGGSHVRIEIGVDTRTSGRVVVTVRDDGPGIADARRASIFENGISYRDGGTGHGLSFVRVVVEGEMGGTVRLLSPEDSGGACFQLELPAVDGESAP